MWKGVFINLDRATDRLHHMQAELARFGLSDRYERIPGVVGPTGITGCMTAHLNALRFAASQDAPTHIMEDDTILSDRLAPFLKSRRCARLLAEWDLLFLDMWIDPIPSEVAKFQAARSRPGPMNLRGVRVGCTSSYVVTPRSARQILDLLTDAKPAIDMRLNDLVQAGTIRAAVMMPFLTGVDITHGVHSDVQADIYAKHWRDYILLRTAFFIDQKRQESARVR